MRCNEAGVSIIKQFETLSLKPYLCPAGKWTIGWGHTGDVGPNTRPITVHEAESILDVDLDEAERGVQRITLGAPLNENQFSALVSLAFNVGAAALDGKGIILAVRRGDWRDAAERFPKWNKARNKKGELVEMAGLTRRRLAERRLFLLPPASDAARVA